MSISGWLRYLQKLSIDRNNLATERASNIAVRSDKRKLLTVIYSIRYIRSRFALLPFFFFMKSLSRYRSRFSFGKILIGDSLALATFFSYLILNIL